MRRCRNLPGITPWLTAATLLILCLLAGCGPKIDCSDNTQMLSPDRNTRAAWLHQCREVNRRVTIDGQVQPSPSQ